MNPQTLQECLLRLKETAEEQTTISVRTILQTLSGKGRLLILMLLSLPFCLPIPLPGLSVPFGLLIAFIGIRITFAKHLWLPSRILSKKVQSSLIKKIVNKTMRVVKKMQVWTHPRLMWLAFHPIMHIVNGLIIFFLGIALALPIPIPFSNITAAWGVFIISLGIIEDDGIFILVGQFIFLITIIIYAIIGTSIQALF